MHTRLPILLLASAAALFAQPANAPKIPDTMLVDREVEQLEGRLRQVDVVSIRRAVPPAGRNV